VIALRTVALIDAAGGDPFDRVLGSTAIASVADATLILVRDRMQNAATLAVTGRDIEERELAIQRDPLTALWSVNGDGNPKTVALTPLHHRVLNGVSEGHNTNSKLCDLLGKSKGEVGKLLSVLVERGHLEKYAGVYGRVGSQSGSQGSQSGTDELRTIESTSRTIENGPVRNGSQGSQGLAQTEKASSLMLELPGLQTHCEPCEPDHLHAGIGRVEQDKSGSQPPKSHLRTVANLRTAELVASSWEDE